MTYRQLRQILFYVDNQKLNVKELRETLFDIENQDDEIDVIKLGRITAL